MELSFGCTRAIPPEVETAWGARFIFPDDVLWDRQDLRGPDKEELKIWLNQGALQKARAKARELAQSGRISQDLEETVVLHDDALGTIVGNPQRSFGYLYVAAWLK